MFVVAAVVSAAVAFISSMFATFDDVSIAAPVTFLSASLFVVALGVAFAAVASVLLSTFGLAFAIGGASTFGSSSSVDSQRSTREFFADDDGAGFGWSSSENDFGKRKGAVVEAAGEQGKRI